MPFNENIHSLGVEDISQDMCMAKDEFEITECPRS